MKYRTEGFVQLDEGNVALARENFMKAASFADKAAQAVLAEMAWKGIGQPVDRVAGYVWADIAAERGYPGFVAVRERYWQSLTEAEKARALEVGRTLMDEYGDAAARKRMSLHLRKARSSMIGGRPRKNAEVVVPGPNGQSIFIRGHHFYADRFWDPDRYQEWVDATWGKPAEGTVDVGSLEQIPDRE